MLWLAIILIGFAVILVLLDVRYAVRALSTLRWPSVDNGEITSSGMERITNINIPGMIPSDVKAVIHYKYRVEDQEYYNSKVRAGFFKKDRVYTEMTRIQRIVSRYPKGRQVHIFYKPSNPKKSVLEPGGNIAVFTGVLIAAMIFGGAGLIFTTPEMLFWAVNLISYAVIGIALLIFAGDIQYLLRSIRSKRWPTTPGVVLGSSMLRGDSSDGGPTYAAIVLYEYEVEGIKYINDQVGMNYGHARWYSTWRGFVMMMLDALPPGETVHVYYDPKNHSESVLKPGLKLWEFLIFIGIGLGIFFLGWLFPLILTQL